MKAKFTEWSIAIVFSIVGVGLIVVGIYFAISIAKFKDNAIETTARVMSVSRHTDSDGDTSYTVYVTYNVSGKTYNNSYSTSSYINEGDSVKVYYDKNDPRNMRTTTSSIASIIMTVCGIIFGIIGLSMLFYKINKEKRKATLLENGERVLAELEEVTVNYSYSVNNRHPYVIICQGKDMNGEIRTFKSENIWYNPEQIIQERNITTFPVYIDINNPKKYYVSLEEIEEKNF